MIHKLFQMQTYSSFILKYILLNIINLNSFMWFSRNSSKQVEGKSIIIAVGEHFSSSIPVLSYILCVKCKIEP